ncbi:MAG: hypothetical protein ABJB61_13415 [bacterium]
MSKKNVLTMFAAALLVFSLNQALNAQRDWIHLGDKHVDGKSDHDKISVGRDDGWFRQLQIRVEDAPVNFQRVVVHFGNGTDEEMQFRERINPGTETRAMDLHGRRRIIKSVDFWYEKANWGSTRPTVRLYGR